MTSAPIERQSPEWFEQRATSDWRAAIAHLRRSDPVLARVIDRVGPCTLSPRRDYFIALCQAIFTQQISTAVATTLFARFRELFPRGRPTPARVLEVLRDELATAHCGLSRQKRGYLSDLSQRFIGLEIPTRRFGSMSDQEIIQCLVETRGVGVWTAQMFLIFSLNRPDVLPTADFGLRQNVMSIYGLRKLPEARTLERLAKPWRPFRSIATWYLWRNGNTKP